MDQIEDYEEKYISAYCRVSLCIWHPGLKDILKYDIENKSFYEILEQYSKRNENTEINLDGIKLKKYITLDKIVQDMIDFLFFYKDYRIQIYLPYEELCQVDKKLYDYVIYSINKVKYHLEIYTKDYVIMIQNDTEEGMQYLKILPDKKVKFGICYPNLSIKSSMFEIDTQLFKSIYQWARQYVKKNIYRVSYEGLIDIRGARFIVTFGLFENLNNTEYIEYRFNEICDNAILEKLFQLPQLKEFILRSEKWRKYD